jgi:uncharacterized protein (TIGR02996 family)
VVDLFNELLGRAARALHRHDEVEALEHLVEAWRHSRAERIAALVERLSKRLTAGLGAIHFEPRSFVLSPPGVIELPLLLEGLVESAERAQPGAVSGQLKAFRHCPADPRFTPALLALARLPVASMPEVTQELCNLLVDMWDPRAVQLLRALHAGLDARSPYAEKLDLALWRIAPRGVPTLTQEAAGRCEALEEDLAMREAADAPGSAAREELLARVYADPEDVSARMVLADRLLEQGNPLGELIMLQCSPHADRERIEQLLAANGWMWSAALGPHVERSATRFERGFPVAVLLKSRWREPLPVPTPRWRTVRELDLSSSVFPDLAEWLSHPDLRGVTTLKRVTPSLVRGFAARALGVRRLGLSGPGFPVTAELFTDLARLPKLARLFIRDTVPEAVHLCAASPLASRLERFEARDGGAWAFVVAPARDVPLRATLVGEEGTEPLAQVLRGAVGFGTRALYVQGSHRATPEGLRLLKAAASGYARVEWT